MLHLYNKPITIYTTFTQRKSNIIPLQRTFRLLNALTFTKYYQMRSIELSECKITHRDTYTAKGIRYQMDTNQNDFDFIQFIIHIRLDIISAVTICSLNQQNSISKFVTVASSGLIKSCLNFGSKQILFTYTFLSPILSIHPFRFVLHLFLFFVCVKLLKDTRREKKTTQCVERASKQFINPLVTPATVKCTTS